MPTDDHPLPEQALVQIGQLRLMSLLITGATQDTIAVQLNVSVRSLQKQLAHLRTTLGATTAYTCGMLAIRRDLLPAQTIIDRALLHVGKFTEPTMREYE